MFTLGLYRTYEEAEKAAVLWSDVYAEDQLVIEFNGSHYALKVREDGDPR